MSVYPVLWTFLHVSSFKYPYDPRYGQFMRRLFKHMPCAVCRKHAAAACKKWSNKAYPVWLFELHNDVNRRLGKPEYQWAQCQAAYANYPADAYLDLQFQAMSILFQVSPRPRAEVVAFFKIFCWLFHYGMPYDELELLGPNFQRQLSILYQSVRSPRPSTALAA